ncbi:MAG: terminase gpA endonuclease subunit [Burkholderiaceae bacterium]
MSDNQYAVAISDVCSGYAALKPPLRVSVSQGAANNLVIRQTGMAGTPWSADETPYMVEPMDRLASRKHEAVVFVGPARTGKTAGLLLGWMAHTVVNDPGDMLFMQMSKDKAREFSKTDVDRAMTNSPALAAMKSNRAIDANTFDTMFRHGVWLRIAWPTVSNVSGSTYRYVAITDLDRIDNAENVDGEGPLFDLARKRTTTFLSRGMCLAESSPGIELTDPNWKQATPHEAPPVSGILGIYNRSDRARWYWQCPDCTSHFEAAPGLGLFNLPSDDELLERVRVEDVSAMAAEYGSRIICPHCGVLIPAKAKTALNRGGRWVAEGQTLGDDGQLHGTPSASTVAGYWLGGVAAAYQTWKSLVERYLQGLRDYALTGSEETLKATINTDQGMPYMSRHLVESRNASSPSDRTEADLQRYVCPPETRCVVAAVDVQGGTNSRFIVQVHAVGPHMEQWLVNRFEIRKSVRAGMGEEFAQIDPASHPEDWDALTEQLLRATYRTPDEGREIRLKMLVVDSGGEDGVTANAYDWFRRVRKAGYATRVRLYKGASSNTAPVVKESFVGARKAGTKGDIPLYVCNPNLLSDAVAAGLKRTDGGPSAIHFPTWLQPAFFDELGAEVRGKNGVWAQVRKRNESFDLCRMIRAGMLFLGLDKVKDWSNVPDWLAPLDRNSEIVLREDRREMQANVPVVAVSEAHIRRAPRTRRVAASPYLR